MDLISPIETLKAPEQLDGRVGTNRAPLTDHKQIAADNDAAAIKAWLNEFHDSPQTLRAYRKEAERLLLWAIVEQSKPLSSLTREDMTAYQLFLSEGGPPEDPPLTQKRPRLCNDFTAHSQLVYSELPVAHQNTF